MFATTASLESSKYFPSPQFQPAQSPSRLSSDRARPLRVRCTRRLIARLAKGHLSAPRQVAAVKGHGEVPIALGHFSHRSPRNHSLGCALSSCRACSQHVTPRHSGTSPNTSQSTPLSRRLRPEVQRLPSPIRLKLQLAEVTVLYAQGQIRGRWQRTQTLGGDWATLEARAGVAAAEGKIARRSCKQPAGAAAGPSGPVTPQSHPSNFLY